MSNLGFVGLGVMGGRMVKRLLDAGHSVTGYNRTKSRAQWLLDMGMQWGNTPREVAEKTEVVFSMVANTEALYAVTGGEDGIIAGLAANQIYIDMSTVSPAACRDLSGRVAAKGAIMVDAPVSGSVSTLESGTLSFMVGGDRDAMERIQPLLEDIGSKAVYVGDHGQAAAMKVAINLSLPVQMLALSEGILLAERFGISRETALEVMLNGVIASPMLKYRAPLILDMPDEALFDVTMMQKDLGLALEMGKELNVPLPTTSATNQMLTAACGMGLAKKDFASVFEALARMAGMDE